jgi:formylglycine-generating enzyme required for sulfatase activity
MWLPETWTNLRDGSSMRLIPAGPFLMGSTQDEIEAAMRMHKEGPAFALLHETPQFETWRPDLYISVYAVTNHLAASARDGGNRPMQ